MSKLWCKWTKITIQIFVNVCDINEGVNIAQLLIEASYNYFSKLVRICLGDILNLLIKLRFRPKRHFYFPKLHRSSVNRCPVGNTISVEFCYLKNLFRFSKWDFKDAQKFSISVNFNYSLIITHEGALKAAFDFPDITSRINYSPELPSHHFICESDRWCVKTLST